MESARRHSLQRWLLITGTVAGLLLLMAPWGLPRYRIYRLATATSRVGGGIGGPPSRFWGWLEHLWEQDLGLGRKPWPMWLTLRTITGASINHGVRRTDLAEYQRIVRLLAEYGDLLHLSLPDATDAEIALFSGFKNLRFVSLHGFQGTAEGVAVLRSWPSLNHLDLSDSSVDDTALGELRGAAKLEHLVLTDTRITDASMEVLASFPDLRFLDVTHTTISERGLNELRKMNPRLDITDD